MKTLIEIHILQNFAPSNLNRDDTGAPKDAIFGGTRRARVSSQCFKRAVRQHFDTMIQQGTMSDQDIALRTQYIVELITSALVQMGHSPEESRIKANLALSAVKITIKEDGKSQYLLFLGKREIQTVAKIIHEKWDAIVDISEGLSDEKKLKKNKKETAKQFDPELKKTLEQVFNGGKAVDIALFGRMLTDMPSKSQHAACQVAHSISTHSVETEFDFYTAVDDLQRDDSAGAGMLGTVEFNSAWCYRYSNVDMNKLLENLDGDEDLAERGLKAFLEAFVIATPGGKQNTFAAHNPPEFVAVSIRKNGSPRNLANAFESAIHTKRGESITSNSAKKLTEKAKSLQVAFGGDEETFVLNLTGEKFLGFGFEASSLQDLLNKTLSSVKE